jgi:NADPH:quinone reductase and related Zn-dependent oxidoreductases
VIATASIANQEPLKELGADMAIDYTKQKFEHTAKDVDVVLHSVGGDTLAHSYGAVKKGGFIVSIVAQPDRAELDKHGIGGAVFSVEPKADDPCRDRKVDRPGENQSDCVANLPAF